MAAALLPALARRGHRVRALARPYSERRIPREAQVIVGDPLLGTSYLGAVRPGDTFIHLVGTPRPAPWKGESFERVDLGELRLALPEHPSFAAFFVSPAASACFDQSATAA